MSDQGDWRYPFFGCGDLFVVGYQLLADVYRVKWGDPRMSQNN